VQRHAVLQAVGRGLTQLLQLVAVSVIGREIVLKGLLPRLLPLWFATDAINLSGKRLRKQARVQRAQGRPEMRYIRDFIESPGPAVRRSPAFLVVSGPQGVGKSIMLNTIFADYAAEGRHVLLMTQNLLPGQSLDLETILRKALRIDKLPVYFPNVVPEFVEELQARPFLDVVKRKPREPLIIYMQLSTQNRADDFDQNQCEAIAAAVGGFARELTYEYGLCKFVLEVSVSLIADKIQDKFNMSRLVVVDPLPLKSFVELALEKPEIAPYLKMDERSRAEVLKYFYLRAGGSFRELQLLLENAAKANASDAQGIKGEIDQWYETKIQPIKDVLAETEEDEFQQFIRRLLGQKPKSKYLDYVTKVAKAGPKGYLSGGDDKETKLKLELRRLQPAQAVLRSTTSTQVALRHWYFVFYVLGETEKALQDAGYM